jgi:hypothetical protein
MTRNEYIAHGGRRCPVCQLPTIESKASRFDGPDFVVNKWCLCGAEWVEIFELKSFALTSAGI